MISPLGVRQSILISLIAKEKTGRPIKLAEALKRWGDGSAWESLVDCGYINRYPEAVTVTESGRKWLESFPEISTEGIQLKFDADDFCGCEWDRMSVWQKRWMFVFIASVLLWSAPVVGSMLGKDWWGIMPWAGLLLVVSSFFSGVLFMVLKSFAKK